MQPIILASQSPRRKMLLEWAEIPFDIMVVPTSEQFSPEMEPEQIPIHIATQKLDAVLHKIKTETGSDADRTILAADTVVVLGQDILNKPLDREEAIHMLSRLSGQAHRVITGVVLRSPCTGQTESFSVTTHVRFHALTTAQIAHYVDQYKPFDKAGGYAIQEWIGVVGIASIEGDFYNVMGLPVSKVVQALQQINVS